MSVLTDLRNRGVRDTFFVICDCEDDQTLRSAAA
jgi:hypothetical protein